MTVFGLMFFAFGFLMLVSVLLTPGPQLDVALWAVALMGYGIVTVFASRRPS